MMMFTTLTPRLIVILISFTVLTSHPQQASHLQQEKKTEAEKVSLCELKKDPAKYNHRLVEITGFVSHGFEDFTVSDPDCPSWPNVWLEYGGTSGSNTMYCCGVTPSHTRPKELVVE